MEHEMLLDEAITHFSQLAKNKIQCEQCHIRFSTLVDWLKELQDFRYMQKINRCKLFATYKDPVLKNDTHEI